MQQNLHKVSLLANSNAAPRVKKYNKYYLYFFDERRRVSNAVKMGASTDVFAYNFMLLSTKCNNLSIELQNSANNIWSPPDLMISSLLCSILTGRLYCEASANLIRVVVFLGSCPILRALAVFSSIANWTAPWRFVPLSFLFYTLACRPQFTFSVHLIQNPLKIHCLQ